MTNTHSYRGIAWLDLQAPTESEVASLIKRYNLHPLVGEELKRSSSLAKVEFFNDYVLVVLTLPVRVRKETRYEIVDREIDFVIGKNFLITAHEETIEQIEYFAKIFEANNILNKEDKIDHAGFLFYYMVKRIYAGMVEDLENIRDSLLNSETMIFGGEERRMVEVLSGLSRELIDIKQTARMHRDIWEEMVGYADKDFFGPGFAQYVHDIRDEFNVIHELILNARELLTDLRETNDSLLNTRQNDIIKILTIVSFIFYPATFIASWFTIPAAHVPIIDGPYGWSALSVLMIVMTAAILGYFKKKRWF